MTESLRPIDYYDHMETRLMERQNLNECKMCFISGSSGFILHFSKLVDKIRNHEFLSHEM
jgi:hypothetical protein